MFLKRSTRHAEEQRHQYFRQAYRPHDGMRGGRSSAVLAPPREVGRAVPSFSSHLARCLWLMPKSPMDSSTRLFESAAFSQSWKIVPPEDVRALRQRAASGLLRLQARYGLLEHGVAHWPADGVELDEMVAAWREDGRDRVSAEELVYVLGFALGYQLARQFHLRWCAPYPSRHEDDVWLMNDDFDTSLAVAPFAFAKWCLDDVSTTGGFARLARELRDAGMRWWD